MNAGSVRMLSKLFTDQRATIGVLGAFSIVAVIGFSALAVEFGHGLLQREEDQRIADLAAYGGALVYGSSSGSTTSASDAAANIAALNGIAAGAAATVVNSPTGDGNQAMQVTVTTNVPLLLARVLTRKTTLPVSATAYAEIKSGAPGCIIALSSAGTGVTVSSAAAITADDCAVASNAAVTAASASTITTKVVDYGTSYSTSGASSINPPSGTPSVRYSKTTTTDPLSGNSDVTTVTARLSTVSSVASPTVPTPSPPVSGGNVSFGLASITGALPTGCTTTSKASPWTVNCTGTGTFTFGALTVSGATTATFNTSAGGTYTFSGGITVGSASKATFGSGTFNVSGGISISSSTATFGSGTFDVTGGITIASSTASFGSGTFDIIGGISASSSTATFGSGTFDIGAGAGTCNGLAKGYSICNSSASTLSFTGPDTFVLAGGIYNGGSSKLAMGTGSASNSYNIGAAADHNSINATITSVTLGDATGSGDLFQTAGGIVGSGSNSLTLPAATDHDINGNISVASATTTILGAGIYTVTGYVAVGGSSGAATLTGSTDGVTVVVGGATTPASGACAGMAFCAAQASTIALIAPSSGATEDLAVIGPTSSSNTAGALISAASSSSLSGAVYFPYGPVSVGSASGLGGGSGQCLELIGSQVTVSGASAVGTTCSGLGGGGSSGGSVALVK